MDDVKFVDVAVDIMDVAVNVVERVYHDCG